MYGPNRAGWEYVDPADHRAGLERWRWTGRSKNFHFWFNGIEFGGKFREYHLQWCPDFFTDEAISGNFLVRDRKWIAEEVRIRLPGAGAMAFYDAAAAPTNAAVSTAGFSRDAAPTAGSSRDAS